MTSLRLPAVRTVAALMGRPVRPVRVTVGAHRAVPGAVTAHRLGGPGPHLTVPGMRSPRLPAGGPRLWPYALMGAVLGLCMFVGVTLAAAPAAHPFVPPVLSSPPALHSHAKGHLR